MMSTSATIMAHSGPEATAPSTRAPPITLDFHCNPEGWPVGPGCATVDVMSDKAHGRFDLVVEAYRPGDAYRLVMLPDGGYRQLRSRRELDDLASRLGLDPD